MPLLPFDQEPEDRIGGLEVVCIGAIIMFCAPGVIWWISLFMGICFPTLVGGNR